MNRDINGPRRIQRRRTRGWRAPEGAISVTRPGRWGNPFHCADLFSLWLDGKLPELDTLEPRRLWILGNISTLKGHDLMCWCQLSAPCHADELLRRANMQEDIPDA